MKKYILLENDTKNFECRILHRIKAVRDFGHIRDGDIGGYLESERNLSHKGNCWVYDEAMVFEDATVTDKSMIFDKAIIYGTVKICGKSIVCGNTMISGNVKIYNNSVVSEFVHMLEAKTNQNIHKGE